MSQSNDVDGHSAQKYTKASEILRTMDPPTIGTLLFLVDDEVYTQKEIADAVGYSRTTISQSQQSLEDLPLSLATKQGSRYKITSVGETVLGYYTGMARQLNVDLHTLDWQSDEAYERVETILTPLYDSRSTMPFFVLESMGVQSIVGEIDRLATPQRVPIEDIIQDVTTRQRERDERVTSKQIRQVVRRFDDRDAVDFDGDHVVLEEKGQEHAYLLDQVVQLVEEQTSTTDDEESTRNGVASETGGQPNTSDDRLLSDEAERSPENIAQQNQPHGFLGRRASSADRKDTQEPFLLVPAYCLDSPTESNADGGSHSQPQPVLPLTALTAGELTDRAQEIEQEYGEDAELAHYWMMQTADGLHPVGSMDALAPVPSEDKSSEND